MLPSPFPRQNHHAEYSPVIQSIAPTSGHISHFTTIRISGRNLGRKKTDLYDIGIVTDDTNIPVPDNAQRIAAPHISCLWTARYFNSTLIECDLSPFHGGYRNENGTINRSMQGGARGGFIYVHTRTAGVGFNRQARFRFTPDCRRWTDKQGCREQGCYWCLYTTTCLAQAIQCVENCATEQIHMSCGEFYGIITITVLLGTLLVAIALFVRYQRIQARLALGYIDPKEEKEFSSPLLSPDSAEHSTGNINNFGGRGGGNIGGSGCGRRGRSRQAAATNPLSIADRLVASRVRQSGGTQFGSLTSMLSSYQHRYLRGEIARRRGRDVTNYLSATTDEDEDAEGRLSGRDCLNSDDDIASENEDYSEAANLSNAARRGNNSGNISSSRAAADEELLARLLLLERKHQMLKQPNKLTSFF